MLRDILVGYPLCTLHSPGYSSVFRDRNLAVILVLGFASGLPLALTGATLQAWLTVEGVDLATIGLVTLVGIPYTWKFLWAPLLDRYMPPFLGRRRGWLAITQLALAAGIAAMAFCSLRADIALLAALAVFVAFASASQDIVFDAYRTDIAAPEARGLAAAMTVVGYRVAMLTSGAMALVLVAGAPAFPPLSWKSVYLAMAALMSLCVLATLWGREPEVPAPPPRTLEEAIAAPLREFFGRPGAWAILALIVLYKLGDAFAGNLTTAFLLRGPGFTATEVGAISKGFGLAATIAGALAGGALMAKLRLYRALLLFGALQAVTNLGFMALAASGKDYLLLYVVIGAENLSGGMGTAAYVALLMALCDRRFSATQYALLSALSAVGRVYVGPLAGYLVAALGWQVFFFCTFLIALPGVAMLVLMRATIDALDQSPLTGTVTSSRSQASRSV